MNKKRYVVLHEVGHSVHDDSKEAHITAGRNAGSKVYELGREVLEPDYGPLVEWVKLHKGWLLNSVGHGASLDGALKAAQID